MKRSKFYTLDYNGFLYYNISRAYNDLFLNNTLFENLYSNKDELAQSSALYIFKNGMSNLKEILKLLRKVKTSSNYKHIYDNWMLDTEIKTLYDSLTDEIEEPKDRPNSINARYLSIRNDVFHYCTDTKDYRFYVDINTKLINNNIDVKINCDTNGDYSYEIGSDLPLTYGTFDNNGLEEINNLRNTIINLLHTILKKYYKSIK